VPLRAILLWGATRLAGKAVYFYVDGAYVGAATTDALGVAARGYTIPADAAYGPHNVMVYFGGDTDYASTSRTAPVLIVRRPTAISFFASRGRPGDRIQLRALLTSEGVGVAGKTMTFYVSGVMIGTATTDASGVAAIDYSIPLDAKPGVYDVGATFAGDNDYAPSGRTAAVLTVL
jgi:hypothetical protein